MKKRIVAAGGLFVFSLVTAENELIGRAIYHKAESINYTLQAIEKELEGNRGLVRYYSGIADKERETGEKYSRIAKKYGLISNARKLWNAF